MELNRLSARGGAHHVSEIVAAAAAYPSEFIDNPEYARRCKFKHSEDWDSISEQSGIFTRRWCSPQENTRTLAEAAVRCLLQREEFPVSEIDVVVVASGTSMNMAHPTDPENRSFADLSPILLKQIGAQNRLGLDIKACYCTGFLRGMQLVDGLLCNPNYRLALLVAAEQGSRFATASGNRSAFCAIAADGAGAMVFRRRATPSKNGILDYCGYTDVEKSDWVGIGSDANTIIMRGEKAGSATQDMLVECAERLLTRNGLSARDVDWLLPIQTHRGLLHGVLSRLKWPEEKLLWQAQNTGFSGSASIPSCFADQLAAGRLRRGQLVLSVAVGAGMNCAGALYYA